MSLIVGPIVGEAGAPAASGGGTLLDIGEGYDFAIAGLGFRMAISDERPYERATAQFRKEQFDTSDSPGDQSLLGYWTRGQLTHHGGAGMRYAELAGEDSTTRYWDGVGVNPFVKGEVSLHPAWGAATTDAHTGVVDCQPVGADQLAVLADGRVTYGALGAAGVMHPAASSSRSVQAIAAANDIYCAMSDNMLDRIGLTLTYPVVYGEQGFESGIDGFFSSNGLSTHEVATVATDGTKFDVGAQSLKTTWPASGAHDQAFVARSITGLTPGRSYTMVARVWCDAGTGANIRPTALFNSTGPMVGVDGAWTTVSFTFIASSISNFVGFENTNLNGSTPAMWMDRYVIYEGSRVGFDAGTTPVESIYSHTQPLTEVHYAKDRLFVMDDDGVWYQLAPNPSGALPVAIGAGDRVFTATTSGRWSVCDTPGPVLFGNQNRVFAVTQDTDGLFPTLTAPIQVADLPIGETIIAMTYYLGFVVLVTTKGVRVAVLGDNAVTYGPRLLDWDIPVTRSGCARAGESVYVAADDRVIEINLASQTSEGLEFGWAELPTVFSGETAQGVTQAGGKVVAWGDDVLQVQQATPVASGWFDTPYQRFGTLEPKKFHTVSVRVGGDGGSVTVSRVTPTAVVSLYTIPVSGEDEEEITLRADTPLDRLGLRFTLTADGANSPKLLSYQLRALPAPIRQRMIRVPLALHDVERRGTTRAKGRKNGAWERLEALESLESAGTIVTFQDFRTGESGQCYIEQVAHEGDTPPGRQGDGFGGVVSVTLRKL